MFPFLKNVQTCSNIFKQTTVVSIFETARFYAEGCSIKHLVAWAPQGRPVELQGIFQKWIPPVVQTSCCVRCLYDLYVSLLGILKSFLCDVRPLCSGRFCPDPPKCELHSMRWSHAHPTWTFWALPWLGRIGMPSFRRVFCVSSIL